MKLQNYGLVLIPAIGTVLGGILWLIVYIVNHTKAIGFDGSAGGALLLSLFTAWLISSTIALLLYTKRNDNRNLLKAIAVVVTIGIIVGLGTGIAISQYSMSHFSNRPAEPM